MRGRGRKEQSCVGQPRVQDLRHDETRGASDPGSMREETPRPSQERPGESVTRGRYGRRHLDRPRRDQGSQWSGVDVGGDTSVVPGASDEEVETRNVLGAEVRRRGSRDGQKDSLTKDRGLRVVRRTLL